VLWTLLWVLIRKNVDLAKHIDAVMTAQITIVGIVIRFLFVSSGAAVVCVSRQI
jgi:hypothetical protein